MALFTMLIILACLHVDSLRGAVGSTQIDCVHGSSRNLGRVDEGYGGGVLETITNISPDDRLVLEPYLSAVAIKYLELVYTAGSSTATVRIIKPLDADEIMMYADAFYYSITCVGGAKNIRTLIVMDINDNPPVFQTKSYGITVWERIAVGSTVLTVSATDNDVAALNKKTLYSILPPVPDEFELSYDGPMNECNIKLTKPLNYNNVQHYKFIVKARDVGALSDTMIVAIAVKDEDNLNPYFDHCLYKASIEENQVGHFSDITPEAIKAQDGDKGINTSVVYSITTVIPNKYQNNFEIDVNSGVISVTKALDREETEQISVFIQAAQQNDARKTAETTVLVTIVDVNDILQKFDQGVHSSHFA
ncbi:protocadherin-like wing polarity protein stan [Cyprinus carpio]|uniref:Protocadherin-like wing polarity protein stan n=1 Tax=Cyprinus carpio TaxID=7962 RepID=A0A9Q9W560_CYPCA|nr:protocadherin-like wing polarity protein stan [Cyprinus carpio]